MKKFIGSIALLFSLTSFAEVVILHEVKEDLNKDGKKDSIAWVAKSKDAKRPSRLVIRVPGQTLLDLSGNFCRPVEKSADCTALTVEKRLTTKKEPLLIFRTEESTWTYKWDGRAYRPYLASWKSHAESFEINYSTGRVLVTSSRKTETCPLKNSRSQEDLSSFNLFDIRNEADCVAAAQ